MNSARRSFSFALAMLIAPGAGGALAQGCPGKPIRLVAGRSVDAVSKAAGFPSAG